MKRSLHNARERHPPWQQWVDPRITRSKKTLCIEVGKLYKCKRCVFVAKFFLSWKVIKPGISSYSQDSAWSRRVLNLWKLPNKIKLQRKIGTRFCLEHCYWKPTNGVGLDLIHQFVQAFKADMVCRHMRCVPFLTQKFYIFVLFCVFRKLMFTSKPCKLDIFV